MDAASSRAGTVGKTGRAGGRLLRRGDLWVGTFEAMASPCEVLCSGASRRDAREALAMAQAEALRIERKFSRYRDDSVVHAINQAGGEPIEVDAETARLLAFADRCHTLSDGGFDVTSGVLGRVWRFDGSDRLPDPAAIAPLLELVGWWRVSWSPPRLVLPAGMQIDLGGIGKEYAVDRVAGELAGRSAGSYLVNFGGDIAATGPRAGGEPWQVGVEDPWCGGDATRVVPLARGGLATSGDARRFLLRDGVRYGHILDPRTGWPVEDAPRSVTVRAATCTEAGLLATLAMLQGAQAERFLRAQTPHHWCVR
ncbi:MAG: FAD:protein FMN transferase [Candidatus Eiseniibacteriota bacterium]|jgi:thiamine biosynthesis lipoprotein